ncbi:DNA-binding HTH domain, TetR-type, partial [Klenkia terrae]
VGGVPTPVREQQRRDSWAAVQAAALALVSERGFDAVTVEDVAVAAGVSRRTFFNHFPTKAAALFDPHPDDAEALAALLAGADTSGGVWPALREVCLALVARQEEVLAVRRRLVGDPELDAYHRTAHRHVGEAIDGWVGAQLPDDPFSARLVGETAAAVLMTAFLSWSPDDDPARFAELVGRGFDLVGTGFA